MNDFTLENIWEWLLLIYPYLIPLAIVLIIISLLVTASGGKRMSKKLATSYDFFQIISQFGTDNTRDELIVYSKDPNRAEHKMLVIKHNLGMDMILYDKVGTILKKERNVTVNEVAIVFQRMWQPPPSISNKHVNQEKVKKNKPLVFK